MSLELGPYPEYRDSGIPWLGEIPAHWNIERLKTSVLGCINGTWGNDPDGYQDLACVRVADFDRYSLRVRFAEPTLRSVSTAERHRRTLQSGDLLLEKSGGGDLQPVGAVMLYDHDSEAVCSNFVARMPIAPGFDSRYLVYLHSHLYSIRLNVRSIKQTTGIQNLDSDAYLSELVAFPSTIEQREIAEFLDLQSIHAARLIRAKLRLIELLNEQKQAIIHRAVTRGLDPGVPMKPTGLDWLPEVPEHWDTVKIARIARVFNGTTPSRMQPQYWEEGTIPWLSSGKVNDYVVEEPSELITTRALGECSLSLVPRGSVILGMIGQGKTRGMSAFLDIEACVNQNLAAIVPERGVGGRFLHHLLTSFYRRIRNYGRGGNQEALNCEIVSSFHIPLPPSGEQAEICQRIAEESGAINAAIQRARREIELIREYRTRLISDVVTGKLDVRGVKLPEVEEAEVSLDGLDPDEAEELPGAGEVAVSGPDPASGAFQSTR